MPVWTHYFAHFVVAVIATISFGITFQMPRRHYLACGLTGAVGWMVYIFGVELFSMKPAGHSNAGGHPAADRLRAVLLGPAQGPGHDLSAAGHLPAGAGGGHLLPPTIFLQGEEVLFASKGAETFKVALALALGIALVCSLPLPGATNPKSSPIPRSARTGYFLRENIVFAGQTSII